jgi:putative glutamine amidotransferase
MQSSLERRDVSHKVTFEPKTKFHRMLGPFAYTNSFHHQAIDRIGSGLCISGTTADGIIEAIEMPSHSFVLGVQWHPECMLSSASDMKQLFHALIYYSK